MPRTEGQGEEPKMVVDALWWASAFVTCTHQQAELLKLAATNRKRWQHSRTAGYYDYSQSIRASLRAQLHLALHTRSKRRKMWANYQEALINDGLTRKRSYVYVPKETT